MLQRLSHVSYTWAVTQFPQLGSHRSQTSYYWVCPGLSLFNFDFQIKLCVFILRIWFEEILNVDESVDCPYFHLFAQSDSDPFVHNTHRQAQTPRFWKLYDVKYKILKSKQMLLISSVVSFTQIPTFSFMSQVLAHFLDFIFTFQREKWSIAIFNIICICFL